LADLESSSDSEHAVVGFAGWKALQRELDGVILFRDEIVGSERTLYQYLALHFGRASLSERSMGGTGK
jgi:hypothetical protein